MSFEIFTVPLHAGATADLPVNVRLFVAAIAGFGAAAFATLGLDRFDDGDAALAVLVASVTGKPAGSVTPRSTSLFVYALGMILGMVFEGVVIVVETFWSPSADVGSIAGVGLAEVAAAAAVALALYASITYLAVPRYTEAGTADTPEHPRRRTWLALSATFGLALAILVPVAFLLLTGGH